MAFENLKQQLPPINTLKTFSTQFDRSPVLRCKFMTDVVLEATTSQQEFSHGLGQGFTHLVVTGVSPANVVIPLDPSLSSDATKRCAVQLQTAVVTTIRVQVFY